ncbi:CHAP domain-containing protein [Actinomadura atramentaria]|uniref:CHAP domain-containing protein n=1 Tax=Actinomadura atramentaria TaxID=1990 RepID=UPI0003782D32|nr:CHAP domain-containing protein [Actinomadura atramentaria]
MTGKIGRHRKPGPLAVALRTTGALVAGAALAGTAAASAQAAVPGPDHRGGDRGSDRVSAATAGTGAVRAVGLADAPAGDVQDRFDARHDDGPSLAADLGDGLGTPLDGGRDAEPDTGSDTLASRLDDDPGADLGPRTLDAPGDGADRLGGRADERDLVPAEPGDGGDRPTAQELLKVAESQVGVHEDGGGETKFQDWYMSTDRAKETVRRDGGSISGYKDASWCSMFVSWVGNKVGFSDQVGQDAWTIAHAEWFKDEGRWGTKPKPGAVVFFSWDGGKSLDSIEHVGFVVKDNGDGTVETVEGNTSNAVKMRTRDTDQIVGYGYPDYAK